MAEQLEKDRVMAKKTKKMQQLTALGQDIASTAEDLDRELQQLKGRVDGIEKCMKAAKEVNELIQSQLDGASQHPLLEGQGHTQSAKHMAIQTNKKLEEFETKLEGLEAPVCNSCANPQRHMNAPPSEEPEERAAGDDFTRMIETDLKKQIEELREQLDETVDREIELKRKFSETTAQVNFIKQDLAIAKAECKTAQQEQKRSDEIVEKHKLRLLEVNTRDSKHLSEIGRLKDTLQRVSSSEKNLRNRLQQLQARPPRAPSSSGAPSQAPRPSIVPTASAVAALSPSSSDPSTPTSENGIDGSEVDDSDLPHLEVVGDDTQVDKAQTTIRDLKKLLKQQHAKSQKTEKELKRVIKQQHAKAQSVKQELLQHYNKLEADKEMEVEEFKTEMSLDMQKLKVDTKSTGESLRMQLEETLVLKASIEKQLSQVKQVLKDKIANEAQLQAQLSQHTLKMEERMERVKIFERQRNSDQGMITDLENRLDAAATKNSQIQFELDKESETVKHFQTQLSQEISGSINTNKSIKELEDNHAQATAEVMNLTETLEAERRMSKSLREELAATRERMELEIEEKFKAQEVSVTAQVNKMKEDLIRMAETQRANLEASQKEADERTATAKHELEQEKDTSENLRTSRSELESELNECRASVEQEREEVAKLTKSLETEKESIEKESDLKTELERRIEELQQSFETSQAELESQGFDLDQTREALAQAGEDLKKAQAETEEVRENAGKERENFREFQRDTAAVHKTELDESQKQAEELQKQIQVLHKQVNSLQESQRSTAELLEADSEDQLTQLKQQVENERKEFQNEITKFNEERDSLLDIKIQFEKSQESLKELEVAHDEALAELDRKSADLEHLDSDLETLKEDLDSEKMNRVECEQALKKVTDDFEAVAADLETSKARLEESTEALENTRTSHDRLEENMESENERHEALVNGLEETNLLESEKSSKLSEEIEGLRVDLESKTELGTRLQIELTELGSRLQTELDAAKHLEQQLTDKVESTKEGMQKLSEECLQLSNSKKLLAADLEHEKSSLEQKNKEIEDFRQKESNLVTTIAALEASLDETSKELEQSKLTQSTLQAEIEELTRKIEDERSSREELLNQQKESSIQLSQDALEKQKEHEHLREGFESQIEDLNNAMDDEKEAQRQLSIKFQSQEEEYLRKIEDQELEQRNLNVTVNQLAQSLAREKDDHGKLLAKFQAAEERIRELEDHVKDFEKLQKQLKQLNIELDRRKEVDDKLATQLEVNLRQRDQIRLLNQTFDEHKGSVEDEKKTRRQEDDLLISTVSVLKNTLENAQLSFLKRNSPDMSLADRLTMSDQTINHVIPDIHLVNTNTFILKEKEQTAIQVRQLCSSLLNELATLIMQINAQVRIGNFPGDFKRTVVIKQELMRSQEETRNLNAAVRAAEGVKKHLYEQLRSQTSELEDLKTKFESLTQQHQMSEKSCREFEQVLVESKLELQKVRQSHMDSDKVLSQLRESQRRCEHLEQELAKKELQNLELAGHK